MNIRPRAARSHLRLLTTLLTVGALFATSVTSVLARPGQHPARSVPFARAGASHSGGTVTYRDGAPVACVDPLIAPTTTEGLMDYTTMDNLVLLDGKGVARPDLATHWTYSHGGKWVTFYLRKGVTFSNGDPVDASVIQYNMNRILGPVGQAAGMSTFLGPLASVHVDNKYKVTFRMRTVYRPLLASLLNDSLGIIDPKALKQQGKTQFCLTPVGSGPFMIQNVAPGESQFTLVRNPKHNWETPWALHKGPAYLSKIIVKPIQSDSTAVSELLSGGLDISSVAGDQLKRVQSNKNIKLYKAQQEVVESLGFNTSHSPLNSVDVRKGISEAVDRSALITAVLHGLGRPAYSPVPSHLQYYDPKSKSEAPQYNPTDAQKILSANHVTGPFTLLSQNSPTASAADELIQAELGAVGVKVNIVLKAGADYISLAQKGDFDLILDGVYGVDADILFLDYNSTQETSGGLNFTFYKNAQLDKLTLQGRSTNDPKKAAAAYAGVQKFVLQKVLEDPLWSPVVVFGANKRVHGFHMDATGLWPLFQDLYLQ
jgi:peptide/nickel transport system substrate-binding protein